MENTINIQIVGNSTNLTKAVMDAERHLNGFRKTMDDVGKYVNSWTVKAQACSMIFVGIRNAFQVTWATINGLVGSFVEFGDQLSKTSQRIGMSVESLGGLKYAAEQCGSNFEEMTDAVKTFQEQLGAAKLGDTGAIGKLGAVGIRAKDFDGLSSEEQFLKLADHIRQIGDRAEQTRTAIELFGDAGFRLLPFFQEGKEGIRKLIEEGKEIGAVLGEESAQNAVELADSMNRVKTSFVNVGNAIMSLLAPTLTSLLNITSSLIAGTMKLASEWGDFLIFFGAASTFTAIAANISMLCTGIKALAASVKALTIATFTNPLLLGAVGIAAGITALYYCLNTFRKAYSENTSEIEASKKILDEVSESTKKLAEAEREHGKAAEELKKEADSWNEIADAIEKLNGKEVLNNSEKREMAKLIDQLKAKFPDLGIAIDENTGKVKDLRQSLLELNHEKFLAEKGLIAEEMLTVSNERRNSEADKESILGKILGLASVDPRLRRDMVDSDLTFEQRRELAKNSGNEALITLWDAYEKADANVKAADKRTGELEEQFHGVSQKERDAAKEIQLTAADSASDSVDAFLEKEAGVDEFEKERREIRKEFAKLRKETDDGIAALEALQKSEELDEKNAEKLAKLKTFRDTLEAREQDKLAGVDEKEMAAFQEFQNSLEIPELPKPDDPQRKKWSDRVRKREDQLADAIASGDQDKVAIAREKVEEAKRNRDLAFMKAAGKEYREAMEELKKAQMSGIWDEIEKAEKKVELARQDYLEYSGRVQANREGRVQSDREGREPLPEEEIQDAVQTSMRVSGAFSAYGLEAAAAGTNIAMETLDYIKKIFGQVEEVKNNQTSGVLE